MARFTFNLPDIGEGIAEAEIVAWHVGVGDRVEEDSPLADMMTDKATVEMESPVAGVIAWVAGEVGDVIAIGGPLVVVETEGEGEVAPDMAERIEVENPDASDQQDAAAAVALSEPHAPTPTPTHGKPMETPAMAVQDVPRPPTSTPEGMGESGAPPATAKVLASPAVRARAKALGVDLGQVRPQEGARVRHADLDAFLAYSDGFGPAAATRADESIKVTGLRRRIAENMAASKRAIPHFTYVEECDVTALEEIRAQLNSAGGGPNTSERPKLTILPLLITAICRALPDFPMLNARYDDEANVITRHGAVHMGIATMTDAGLMVPVIRDAHTLNLWQLAREITRLAEAARSGKAKPHELSGSTLTVTSLGPLGGIASTPVINRPEVAIIGPNRIVERPAFIPDGMGGERIAKRKLMNISISCDHRVVDGYDAAAFVQAIKGLIEAPARIIAG